MWLKSPTLAAMSIFEALSDVIATVELSDLYRNKDHSPITSIKAFPSFPLYVKLLAFLLKERNVLLSNHQQQNAL